MANQNIPTYTLDTVIRDARNTDDYPNGDDPLTDKPGDGTFADPVLGCNKAGSCAPGIGIATAVIDPSGPGDVSPSLEQVRVAWTLLDQDAGGSDGQPTPNVRVVQQSQHLGGLAEGLIVNLPSSGGSQALTDTEAIRAAFGVSPVDIDDTVSFVEAIVAAVEDAGMGTAGADPINRSNRTLVIGERLWGTNDVP